MDVKILPPKSNKKPSNGKLITLLLAGVLFMFGFCYMLVPLYALMCTKLGINGKSANSATAIAANMAIDKNHRIKVSFTTTINSALQFAFLSEQRHLIIHPGERKLVYFYVENLSGKDITVQAIPSVTPADAARFLKKTECFCFTQQFFAKNEKAKMPVYFFIEPGISPEIKEITLSYTLFDASDYLKNQKKYTEGRIKF